MTLKIPPGSFRAYLFDCDGTIVDSMPLHFLAWQAALAPWNCAFDEEQFYAWGGRSISDIIAALNARDGLQMPVEATAQRREDFYCKLLHELKPVPEVLEHILAQHGRTSFAVVSGSSRESVLNSLKAIGLAERFPIIIGSEDYARSKPAPDAYLVAAARVGVAPKDCLVFEDTEIGLLAAASAGMKSVRVPSPLERRRRAAAAIPLSPE